jgi:hypothetical protein
LLDAGLGQQTELGVPACGARRTGAPARCRSKLVRVRVSPAWLWVLVVVQVAIPASYYLGRGGHDDERFAWRMFSAVRLKRCNVDAFDGELDSGAPVDVARAVHASWAGSLARGRRRVIARFLATRCEQPGVRAASLARRCQSPSGRRLPVHRYRYDCASGALSEAP